jgi:hypothetical protein
MVGQIFIVRSSDVWGIFFFFKIEQLRLVRRGFRWSWRKVVLEKAVPVSWVAKAFFLSLF